MSKVGEAQLVYDWRNMDCAQLGQLIQRLRVVRESDVKLVGVIELSQNELPEHLPIAQVEYLSSPRSVFDPR